MITTEAALAALSAECDPTRAEQMRIYHKVVRPYLGLSNAVTGVFAAKWRKSCDHENIVRLADGLWASNIFEARIAAGKLFLQNRLRPDDDFAWNVIAGFVPEFDSWAIADAVAQSGQKRLLQVPARLNDLESWTHSPHLWTRRAALVFALPFAKSRDPGLVENAARDRILTWCERLSHDPEWFLQKAVAWWLRDLSKRAPDRVADFIATSGQALKPWAQKEAMKYVR